VTKRQSARSTNNRIATQAAHHRLDSPFPMVCECDDPLCSAVVLVSLSEFEETRAAPANYLFAPGHAGDELEELGASTVPQSGPDPRRPVGGSIGCRGPALELAPLALSNVRACSKP
jgi:hypothetical protein